jgi:hypothetical protein
MEVLLSEEDEKTVQEGQAATDLLDSPAFLMAIERIRAQCAEQILASPPGEPEVREQLYNLSRGVSAVTEELIAISAAGKSMLENAELSTPIDEDVQAPDEPDFFPEY